MVLALALPFLLVVPESSRRVHMLRSRPLSSPRGIFFLEDLRRPLETAWYMAPSTVAPRVIVQVLHLIV